MHKIQRHIDYVKRSAQPEMFYLGRESVLQKHSVEDGQIVARWFLSEQRLCFFAKRHAGKTLAVIDRIAVKYFVQLFNECFEQELIIRIREVVQAFERLRQSALEIIRDGVR